jgi:hypothetical protein
VRKKLAVLMAAAMMLVVAASPASAANGSFATGGAHANPSASSGISTAATSGHNCPDLY